MNDPIRKVDFLYNTYRWFHYVVAVAQPGFGAGWAYEFFDGGSLMKDFNFTKTRMPACFMDCSGSNDILPFDFPFKGNISAVQITDGIDELDVGDLSTKGNVKKRKIKFYGFLTLQSNLNQKSLRWYNGITSESLTRFYPSYQFQVRLGLIIIFRNIIYAISVSLCRANVTIWKASPNFYTCIGTTGWQINVHRFCISF